MVTTKAKLLTVAASVVFVMSFIGANHVSAKPPLKPPAEFVVVREMAKKEACVEQIARLAPLYAVPVDLAVAIHLHETMGGTVLYAEEPTLTNRVTRMANNPNERKMLASAHGCMHVTGVTLRDMGLHWSEAYGEQGTEAGLHKLKKMLELTKGDKTRAVCKFNGNCKPSYVPSVYAQLPKARKLIAKIG